MSKDLQNTKNETKNFLERFSEMMKKYNYTAYRLAEKSGVERTILIKMQKGTRTLSIENFKKIIDVMQLSTQDDEMLRQAFIEYSFGLERYKTFHDIISFTSKLRSPDEDCSPIQVSLSFKDSILKLNSKSDVSNAIKSIIDNEFAQEEKTGRIFTNMDLYTMYDFMKSHPKNRNKNIDYKHIFEIQKNNRSNSDVLFKTLNIMMLGYPVNYFTVDSYHTNNLINLFSYYIITGEFLLAADKDLTFGYAIKKNEQRIFLLKSSTMCLRLQSRLLKTQRIL